MNAPKRRRLTTNAARELSSGDRSPIGKLFEIVWVPGRKMRGKAFSTPELDASLSSVAKLMSISTLWDFVTTIPLFSFSLSLFGWASFPAGTALSFILLWASNVAGENATDRRPRHASRANWSLAAFVLLSAAKTLTAGIGVDLMISNRAIATGYAEKIALSKLAQDRANLTKQSQPDANLIAARQRCDELQAQIDAQVAGGGFAAKSLATVLVGANDLLELYAAFPAQTEEQITAEARQRGERLAAQVNRLVQLGVRVIVSTVPDLGLTPYALQQKAAFADTDRAALISRLTAAFNARLRINILNDGRFVGLVLADEIVQTIVRVPALFAINDATTAACVVALPDCTSQTLASPGAASTWLWADDRHLAYGGQLQLGVLALSRANGNPF